MGEDSWPIYFVYRDQTAGHYYFYNHASGETTFETPSPAWLLDPTRPGTVYDFAADRSIDAPPPNGAPPVSAPLPPSDPPPISPANESFPSVTTPPSDAADAGEPCPFPLTPRKLSAPLGAGGARRRSIEDTDVPAPRPSRQFRDVASMHNLTPVVIDVPQSVREFAAAPAASPHARGPPRPAISFFPDPKQRALPVDLKNEIHAFQETDVAHKFFREHRKPGFFSRSKVDSESLASFQTEPLKSPLLLSHTRASAKASIDTFKLILSFTGADPKDKARFGSPTLANRLITLAIATSELRDEIYFQLIKQTRGNPNPSALLKTWELFLIFATLIPSSRDSEHRIKVHLYQSVKEADAAISDIAQFTYIRFNTRTIIGKPVADVTVPMLESIPKDVRDGHKAFGVSIYEQLWHQRKTYPDSPIPIIVHRMAEALITKGCERWEGIFRLPGSHDRVTRMQRIINEGGECFELADVNDLASLFKSWFAQLPEPIINRDMLPMLKTAWESKAYIPLVSNLAPSLAAVLKDLICLLKRLTLGVSPQN
jgi:hypothetical protein